MHDRCCCPHQQQRQKRRPSQRHHPLSPQAGVKIANQVYLRGSLTGESSVELFDHFDHNISPYSLLESIKIISPDFCCLLISRSRSRTHLYSQVLSFSHYQRQSWVSQVQSLTKISNFMPISFQDLKAKELSWTLILKIYTYIFV